MDKPKKVILVVDDDPDDRMLIVEVLSKHVPDHTCLTFEHGLELLDWISIYGHQKACLITLDINMPILDGFGVLENLRQTDILEELKIVVFTNSSSEGHIIKAKSLGADGFYTKPYSFDQLEKIIVSLVDYYCLASN